MARTAGTWRIWCISISFLWGFSRPCGPGVACSSVLEPSLLCLSAAPDSGATDANDEGQRQKNLPGAWAGAAPASDATRAPSI